MAARAPMHPAERDLRLQLMASIEDEIHRRALKNTQAAELFGVQPPEVAYLMSRTIDRLSLSKLLAWADILGLRYRLSLDT